MDLFIIIISQHDY